jgi:hypothetical protein
MIDIMIVSRPFHNISYRDTTIAGEGIYSALLVFSSEVLYVPTPTVTSVFKVISESNRITLGNFRKL